MFVIFQFIVSKASFLHSEQDNFGTCLVLLIALAGDNTVFSSTISLHS